MLDGHTQPWRAHSTDPAPCRHTSALPERPHFAASHLPLLPLTPTLACLCLQADYDAGSGTCVKDTFICATLVGQKRVLPAAEGETEQVGGRALPVAVAAAGAPSYRWSLHTPQQHCQPSWLSL